MAYIANTMFEVTVSNSVRNQTQNVPGKFGTGTGAEFTPDVCSAGFLCVQNGKLPMEGYESAGIKNGNSWYFNAAVDGSAIGQTGDHTGIYAFNNYDVAKATNAASGNAFNVGFETLGLSLPAGERGDFCEIIIGEQYTFGAGNFTAEIGDDAEGKYYTVSNGLLAEATDDVTSGGNLVFRMERIVPKNEGTTFWGSGYVMKAFRGTVG